MSSATETTRFIPTGHDLRFGGAVRSEWIKLRSIRSTWWSYAILLALTVGFGAQLSSGMSFEGMTAQPGPEGAQAAGVYAVTVSTDFSALVVSVLGVLVIAGEYGTGMIRSTLTAVPKRVPALLAKALVFGAVTFVVSGLALALTVPISVALVANNGIDVDLGDSRYWLSLLGAAAYLALVGLISFGLGALLRNTAGGIAVALGLILAAPLVLSLISGVTQQSWVSNAQNLLPSTAGQALMRHPGFADFISPGTPTTAAAEGLWMLEPWQGGLILAGWVVALFTIAMVLLKRRDA